MNMDIKDLIAKLKGNGGGNKRGGGITGFFDKNPKMKIIIPVIVASISVLIALVIIATTNAPKIDTTPVGSGEVQNVDALPQDVRDLEDISVEGEGVFDDVAISNAKITGIYYNQDGYYTATMVTDTKSYPNLQVGDYVDGSSWQVVEINEQCVVVALGEKEVTIKF